MAAFTSLALLAGGAAVSAYGQWRAGSAANKAGEAQQRASESEAQLTEWNASLEDIKSKDAEARGAEEESRFRSSVRGMIGAQRTGFAASNIDVGFGSAVDVQADTRFFGELDSLTIKKNAMRESWGHKVAAEDLRKRAEIVRREGTMHAATGREQQKAARRGLVRWVH